MHKHKIEVKTNMPRGDRTGPWGLGPMTGRAAGYCAGYPVPGYMNPIPGWGWGMGRGRGRGWGRGFGRGFGRWWGRYPGIYPYPYQVQPTYPYTYQVPPGYPAPKYPGRMPSQSQEDELAALEGYKKEVEDEKASIEQEITELEKRINELKTQLTKEKQ